jgi:hypothetical protein
MRRFAAVLIITIVAAGCTRKPAADTARDTLTRRQKDSAIGASSIPGAQGVEGAMEAADTVNSRTSAIDSAGAEIQ